MATFDDVRAIALALPETEEILADLARIDHGLLRTLLVGAWRLTAPKRLAAAYPESPSTG
jgi:hypothetical protein